MLNEKKQNTISEWQNLESHYQDVKDLHMRDLFESDPARFKKFHVSDSGFLLDYSKNRITEETIALLCDLARACDLEKWRDKMFEGEKINASENRAVLHTALRNPDQDTLEVDGQNIMPEIRDTLAKMREINDKINAHQWMGATGKPIDTVVNIGIGGSELGPKMAVNALKNYNQSGIQTYFLTNIDPENLRDILDVIDFETTLFIVASKTFTTIETRTNAQTIRSLLIEKTGKADAPKHHFAALSGNKEAVAEFGIDEENRLGLPDFVGGRFSLWGSIGLPISIAIGTKNFEDLLHGAKAMDDHFQNAPFEKNIPVLMGLIGIWYRNFFGFETQAILPYSDRLRDLPFYLQQLDMESNGKTFGTHGQPLSYATGPVIFGESGTRGQHAFYQLIHQSQTIIPCDFIGYKEDQKDFEEHAQILAANFIAQQQALMEGRRGDPIFPGNRPSSAVILEKLDPYHFGMLIAAYEHKIFVQGILWGLNSFDQPGVELGKQLAKSIMSAWGQNKAESSFDSSTAALLEFFNQ